MKKSITAVLVISTSHKEEPERISREIVACFLEKKVAVHSYLIGESISPEILDSVNLAISVGGDGTLLYCARMIGNREIPILGINLGDIGFITEISKDEWHQACHNYLDGNLGVSQRIMVHVSAFRGQEELISQSGLNDVVVCSARGSRLVKLNVSFSNLYVNRYRADGVIIATPTGSTGYSLSAGGPILHPEMDSLVVTPICPFTLAGRPIVVPGNEEIEIEVDWAQRYNTILNIDGNDVLRLKPLDRIVVKKAGFKSMIINSDKRNFYEVLRAKLNWSGGPNA